MRRALVALSLILPACLSGFSEIRVVRSDSAVDAARVDAVAPVDVPRAPSDTPDVSPAHDVSSAAMDAPDAVVSGDAASGIDAADVLDAAGQPADAVDVVREDHVDAGAPTDGADVFDVRCPVSRCGGNCIDTRNDLANCGACGRSCATGEACEEGRCGQWEFRRLARVSGDFAAEDGLRRYLEETCASVGGVPCPSEIGVISVAASAATSTDAGPMCRSLLTRGIISIGRSLSVVCWSCTNSPVIVEGGCAPNVPNLLACCAFRAQ